MRLQNGLCLTEVSVYKQGTARATGATLTLTPRISKTRTVVACGSQSDTTTDGALAPFQIGWQLGEDAFGRTQLSVREGEQTTVYAKQGMAPQLVGGWHQGAVRSANFYDPGTQTFAPQDDEGAWYRFNTDGTYTSGAFGYSEDTHGCKLTGWLYQEGSLTVSGGKVTITPRTGMSRIESACRPDQPQQQPYVEDAETYVWSLRDRTSAPKLILIPLCCYKELEFARD